VGKLLKKFSHTLSKLFIGLGSLNANEPLNTSHLHSAIFGFIIDVLCAVLSKANDFFTFAQRTYHICEANISLRSNITCPKGANFTALLPCSCALDPRFLREQFFRLSAN
jgi:hypothetical protein